MCKHIHEKSGITLEEQMTQESGYRNMNALTFFAFAYMNNEKLHHAFYII